MRVNEEVLTLSCTTECLRYAAGTCPFTLHEKCCCPRVKEKLAELGQCCASCANLRKEHPFNQQEWYVCARDVNGVASLDNIKSGIITNDIYKNIDCIAWSVDDE